MWKAVRRCRATKCEPKPKVDLPYVVSCYPFARTVPRPDDEGRTERSGRHPLERPESAQPRHCRTLWRRSLHNPICQPSLSWVAGPRFVEFTTYALATRLSASWMEVRVTKVARLSARFSKFLARRRLRTLETDTVVRRRLGLSNRLRPHS